ncbi:fluoride efflux transporter CrcB [Desulforhabdus amnigena]|jgi:CrcB protein|uniref:Fluoride-specific ion channel FluC n=1 Tax=Desulforhabdus amnigena TaxID=40218 RepID=A0A9W6FVC2_9BACT|nr:fluoride efflux transporter CrcB [Desulforhabdus amnigena]NLJ26531.1 fluoride efflux transporter CrcB [Deltaproteobacteria bacterium]GLI35576.1 putative fluoride ion transporter CrcB [Desulforhabdus amnigena]
MKQELIKILLIMLGGSLGATCRYGTSLLAARLFGTRFAWGTLIVNLVGCFLIGFAFSLADRTRWMGTLPRLFFVTGFLGALTTFSTFALESTNFLRAASHWLTLANFLANNLVGMVLVLLGMWIGRLI